MNRPTLLNWHDVIYRISRPGEFGDFDCWRAPPNSFNTVNFPLLERVNLKNVPTWQDFAMVMGGAQTPFGIQIANAAGTFAGVPAANSGLRLNGWPHHSGIWGRTLGTPGGPNRRPIAESRSLDESFFFHAKSNLRDFRSTVSVNPGTGVGYNQDTVLRMRRDHGIYATAWHAANHGWHWRMGHQPDTPVGARFPNVLQPGVYIAIVQGHMDNVAGAWQSHWINFTGAPDAVWLRRNQNTGWLGHNALFFVDTPVEWSWGWGGTRHWMQMGIFRLTPPGYWNPRAETDFY